METLRKRFRSFRAMATAAALSSARSASITGQRLAPHGEFPPPSLALLRRVSIQIGERLLQLPLFRRIFWQWLGLEGGQEFFPYDVQLSLHGTGLGGDGDYCVLFG